jgi:hypothetical protein
VSFRSAEPSRAPAGRATRTGFMGIVLALQTCKKVSVYGIGKDSSRSGHYYPKKRTSGLADVRQRHPWSMEHACLRMLASLPTVRWLS